MRGERVIRLGEHTSYSSYRSQWSYSLFALLLAAGTGFGAQPAARKPLPETAVLDRVDGRIQHVDANDIWLFELAQEVKTPDYRLPAGTRFVLLPSATLGRLIADVNERSAPRYRLSARVTRFRGQNYLFPTYYLPLSKFKDEKSPEDGGPKTEGGRSPNQRSEIEDRKSEGPEFAIPPEVLEQLKKERPLRGPRRSPEAEKKTAPEIPDRVLVDCVGRIESRQGGYIFVPYALGWNVSNIQYELLPCTTLEEVLQTQRRALDPIRFNVAGLVTEFKGKKYLLLQRAVVVYNYGNFGR